MVLCTHLPRSRLSRLEVYASLTSLPVGSRGAIILNKAVKEWQWLDTKPHIRKFKEPNIRIRWLTQDEAARLLTKLPPHLGAMARFTLATGLRESNILQLEWQQIDMQRRVAWIHPDQAKAAKAIGVPLNDDAVAILKA